jgi:hypothetical protein
MRLVRESPAAQILLAVAALVAIGRSTGCIEEHPPLEEYYDGGAGAE